MHYFAGFHFAGRHFAPGWFSGERDSSAVEPASFFSADHFGSAAFNPQLFTDWVAPVAPPTTPVERSFTADWFIENTVTVTTPFAASWTIFGPAPPAPPAPEPVIKTTSAASGVTPPGPKLPSLSTQVRGLSLPERLVRAVEEMQLFMRIRGGFTGDPDDQYVSRRDLDTFIPTDPTGEAPTPDPEAPDYTPPPTPTGVAALGGYTTIFVTWDAIVDRRIGYFEVWRSQVDNIGAAVKIGQTTGFSWADEVQNSLTYFYWVRSVNTWDASIVSPFNAVGGTEATTAPNVGFLLSLLNGQITESQLYESLGARIDLIDGAGEGSVGARISQAVTTLEEADTVLAQQMLLLSAGVGEQFDVAQIWYFDTGIDAWGGNGTPIATGGWVRPANHETDAYLASPSGLGIASQTYPQVKLRIRRVGAPTWEGVVWWREGASWDAGKTQAFDEPAFDENGIAVVTVNMPWTGTINAIRLDLSAASSLAHHYECDWIAIGRASPGASVAALQQEASVRASETGEINARITVKIDINGYVTGYGLIASGNTSLPSSAFAVRADQFYVASPTGPGIAPTTPFTVQTVPVTVGGVTIEPGVYMTAAYIKRAVVDTFTAGLAVIDNASIKNVNADKILAGKLAVGQYIESQTYISGSSGWRISANGTAEFSGVIVRGTVYASAGLIGGIVIGSDHIRSANYVAGSSGFRFNLNGTGEISNFIVRGTVYATHVVGGISITSPAIVGGTVNAATMFGGAFGPAYAWPGAGAGGGFFLSPQGLLLGNYNTYAGGGGGGYFQVAADGTVNAPNFSLSGGTLNLGGGKFVAYPDGNVYATGVIISRPQIVAAGDSPCGITYNPFTVGWLSEPEMLIDTGYDDFNEIHDTSRPGFIAKAVCSTSFATWGSHPGGNLFYRLSVEATPVSRVDHYSVGVSGPAGGRMFIKIRLLVPTNIYLTISSIGFSTIRWSLLRVT